MDVCVGDQTADIAFARGTVALLQIHIRDAHKSSALLVNNLLPGFKFFYYLWVCKEKM